MDRKITLYLWIAFIIGLLMCGFAWWMHRLPNMLDFVSETQQWWRDFLLNAGAGIITSVLIIFFYDRILMKKEEKVRTLRRSIALDSLQKILDDHFRHVLYGMYRASALEERKFDSLKTFFSEDYFKEIEYFDFNKSPYLEKDDIKQNEVEAYSFVPRNYQIILDYNKRLSEYLLNEVLAVYNQYLEPELCDNIQKLRFSPFIILSHQLPSLTKLFCEWRPLTIIAGGAKPNGFWLKEHQKLIDSLKNHVEIFMKIVELYNQCVSENQKLDLLKNTEDMTLEWGHCRADSKIVPGKYSIKAGSGNRDIQQHILQSLVNMEKRITAIEQAIIPVNSVNK